ncbi:MAG TPA: VOC family protein [Gammaproteobacteria bacterium]|nr:VOC family protein [Gammaproteobacteria bacterium]
MAKVSPFLWFVGNMREAVDFYVSVFEDARVLEMSPMSARFELLGREFLALNAHPHQPFTEAISFFIEVDTQDEVDYYWAALLAGGGKEQMCGWLKDRFGVSWQVIPKALGRNLSDKDRTKAERTMQAMLKMKKIVIADLDKARAG